MIPIQDDTEIAHKRVVAMYISNAPRILGLLHVLDLNSAETAKHSSIGKFGFIRQASLCKCQAPKIPVHIRPGAHCVFFKLGHYFITVRYW